MPDVLFSGCRAICRLRRWKSWPQRSSWSRTKHPSKHLFLDPIDVKVQNSIKVSTDRLPDRLGGLAVVEEAHSLGGLAVLEEAHSQRILQMSGVMSILMFYLFEMGTFPGCEFAVFALLPWCAITYDLIWVQEGPHLGQHQGDLRTEQDL